MRSMSSSLKKGPFRVMLNLHRSDRLLMIFEVRTLKTNEIAKKNCILKIADISVFALNPDYM